MAFLRHTTLTLALALGTLAHAGTFTFVSVSVLVPLGGWQSGTNCTTSNSTKTATITESGSLYAGGPSDNYGNTLAITALLTWKVKWTPSTPGEARPTDWVGILKKHHHPTGGIVVSGTSVQSTQSYFQQQASVQVSDTNVTNVYQNFGTGGYGIAGYAGAGLDVNLGSSANNNTVDSDENLGFKFEEEDGEWIGTALMSPQVVTSLSVQNQWSIPAYFNPIPHCSSSIDINIQYVFDHMLGA